MSLHVWRKRRSLTATIMGVMMLLGVIATASPASAAKQIQYEFNFVNGTTLAGIASDKTFFLAGAGGTDANNPIGMEVHLSCSDKFEGGFGEKDGPDPVRDSAWQIESYSIGELKDGELKLKCGDSFAPPGPPPVPDIQLIKRVNGEDANTVTGPTVNVGSTVTLSYEVINTGTIGLKDVAVTDNDLGPIPCPKTTLAVGESFFCDERQMPVTQPGQVTMEARVDANGGVSGAPTPPNSGEKKRYAFTFVNGTTIAGSSDDKVPFLPNAGGTDVNNPIGMEVHISCSDDFPGGFGEKDGPDPVRDSAWQIAAYTIADDKGKIKCSEVLSPINIPVSDTDPINYIAVPEPQPDISLMKTVNGQDANTAPGVRVNVGDTITLGYKVTNTGNTPLVNVVVSDLPGGQTVPCPEAASLPIGGMAMCPTVTMRITEPGQVFMDAQVDGESPDGTPVSDTDPINYIADPAPPVLEPPTDCTAVVDGTSVKITWTAGNGATKYAVKRNNKWLSRTNALMFTDQNPPAGMHEYFVRSIDGSDRTDYVSCGKVNVPKDPPPTDPPGPADCTVTFSGGMAVVKWTAVDGAKSYQVRANGHWQVRTTHLTFTDKTPGTNYTVEAVFPKEVKSSRTVCRVSSF